MQIPRELEMAMLNAIHTSDVDGHYAPISLCYVAVRAVLQKQAALAAAEATLHALHLERSREYQEEVDRKMAAVALVHAPTFDLNQEEPACA